MKEVPIKLEHDGEWIATKLGIDEESLQFMEPFNRTVKYSEIVDLEQHKNKIEITVSTPENPRIVIATIDKVLAVLKRMILMKCSAYRLNAYFISPAIRGGVMIQNPQWDKGAISVLKSGIWFVSPTKQICVPLDEVAGIELTKREIQDKELDVVKIDHLEDNELVSSLVLCPLTTLQVLYNFLKETTGSFDSGTEKMDDMTYQVAMLAYSGMDTHTIENMLGLTPKQLDKMYEKLISSGMAEVVCVRKEIQLSAKGVRFISEGMKNV